MKTKINHLWWLFLFQFFWLIITSCNPVFEPLDKDHHYYFSIYGYLDASADTNWIRVMPVREQLFMKPEPIDATVTIEDLSSETVTVMNDSLFYYGDSAYAWNFWTTLPLEPRGSYRITAERSDGRSSFVDVELPDDFPTPLVYDSPLESASYDQIFIEGVENLADVRSFHHIKHLADEVESKISVSLLKDTTYAADPYDYVIAFSDESLYETIVSLYRRDPAIRTVRNLFSHTRFLHEQLFIAAAGPGWHHFPNLDENVIALPDGVSNVEGGVGYVAGIVSKTVPYQTCYDEANRWIPCPLEKLMRDP